MDQLTPLALQASDYHVTPIGVIALVAGAFVAAVVLYWLIGAIFKGVGWAFRTTGRLFGHIFACIGGVIAEAVRATGALATAILLLPMALMNVALGRWSASTHYVRAAKDELRNSGMSLYRAAIGWPLRLIGLGSLLEGFEARLVEVVTRAPRGDGSALDFPGYTIERTLPQGGSGAQLFLAHPSAEHKEQLAAQGVTLPDDVVIKAFGLSSGSSLPQMMRENRALEAARRMGLVFEHRSEGDRFYYVMPYVPGDDLGVVTRRLHEASPAAGLSNAALGAVVGYANRLLGILGRFHDAGVWHKDIKPSNIVVNGDQLELIDLGLVTPLASAMTLTTHGTEYYRDPELVRQAMRGVKVHEVDGVKFDLYSAGAVVYSMIEDSFPAHGNLSRITKRCPEALSWIVRRSMAEPRQRYDSAAQMHADLAKLAAAKDPFALRPAELPSMGGALADMQPLPDVPNGMPRRGLPPPLPHEKSRMAAEAKRRRHIEEKEAARRVKHEQRLERSSGGGLRAFVGVGVLFIGILFFGGAALLMPHGQYFDAPMPEAYQSTRDGSVAVAAASSANEPARHFASLADDSERPIVYLLPEVPRELLDDAERTRLDRLAEVLTNQFDWRVVDESAEFDLEDVDEETLVADLRGAALMSSVGDELGRERLEGWLSANDGLDGVLWVGFDGGRIAKHELLVDPDSERFPSRLVERRRLVGSLREAFE
jgi:serine/threonine protein kinase